MYIYEVNRGPVEDLGGRQQRGKMRVGKKNDKRNEQEYRIYKDWRGESGWNEAKRGRGTAGERNMQREL